MSSKTLLLVVALTLGYFCAASIKAQPPAIGPGINTTQAGELSGFTLTAVVRAKCMEIVNEVNAQLQAAGESTRVSLKEVKVFKMRRTNTVFENQPNSAIVRMPFIVTIEVRVPVFGNRFISIPIDIDVACDGWQNAVGNIVVRAIPGPASIEGGSIVEDIIQVRGLIDAKVRNNFVQPTSATVPSLIADTRCKNIGVTDFGSATINDDAIHFDKPPRSRPIIGTIGVTTRPSVEVTFTRLKRLNARDLSGQSLYREVEQIWLNAFANYTQQQKILSMREGDDVALELPPVRLEAGDYEKLVIMGTIEQPPNNPKDTAFRTSLRRQNFSPGSYVLRIPKFFTEPPSRFNPRPQLVRRDAYELSYTVRFIDPAIIR